MDKDKILDLIQDLIDEKEVLMEELALADKVNKDLVRRTSMMQHGMQLVFDAVQDMDDRS